MKIGDFFRGETSNVDQNQASQMTPAKAAALLQRQIRSLVPGQTLQGEILSQKGGKVQIKVLENFILNAKLDQSMNIEVGKNMTFEVKNNGSLLTLSPLFTNTATDANVLKALDMAALPVNGDTVNMTRQMMEGGLSIDRNSLQQMFREVNAYQQAEVVDLVRLHMLSMPVNEANVNQMVSYRNLNHQLLNGMNQVLGELPQVFSNLLENGNLQEAVELYQNILELTLNASPETEVASEALLDGEGLVSPDKVVLSSSGEFSESVASVEANALSGNMTSVGNMASEETIVDSATTISSDKDAFVGALVSSDNGEIGENSGAGKFAAFLETANPMGEDSDAGIMEIQKGEGLGNISGSGTTASVVTNMSDVAAKLQEIVATWSEKQTAGGELHKLLKPLLQQMLKQWTIQPEDVADSKEVEKLYQRLEHQIKGLAKALENAAQTDTPAYKATGNMSENLDFLQQVNQMYSYVQLPLRLQQGNAHGDLYVYSNKKHLAMKEGQISALLHLDMEHLGPVDVYVAMQYEKVNTKFYVQDDAMLDFLEEHMDILTKRLKKRGYDCNFAMQVRENGEKTQGGIGALLQAQNHVPLSEYAFDVRT